MSDRTAAEALDRVRGLAVVRSLLDAELGRAVIEAHVLGVDAMSLAYTVGVSRASLYRKWLDESRSRDAAGEREPETPQASEARSGP